MNQNNISIHNFLISFDLCILYLILLSRTSSSTDFRYEACVPRDCGNGQNISFPFYIPGLQESYCGYPGFVLNCRQDGFPVLRLSENDYVVRKIFYENRTLLVSNAVFTSNGSSCLPRFGNTTIDSDRFGFLNVRSLHLLSNCTERLNETLFGYRVSDGCDDVVGNNWTLALFDGDENLRAAMEICGRNVVAPVQVDEDDGGVVEMLRRGFEMNWTASDCNTCEGSGGHCGFNETSFHFKCFCPDRPHSRSCKPGIYVILSSLCFIMSLLIVFASMKYG